jgi:hypothetical protein
VTCAGHLINTALSNCFNLKKNSQFLMPEASQPIATLLDLCKKLVTHCRQSYIARELSKKLIAACVTRWNTYLDMLDSIIGLYGELQALLRDRGELRFLPGPKDLLIQLADFLRPFKEATVALSAERAPTIHLVAPYYHMYAYYD